MDGLIIIFIIAMLLLGTPLYIAILALGSYFFYIKELPLVSTVISFQKLETQSFLSAIPLFTFAGYILSQSKISLRLVNLSQALFSSIPGTISLVVIIIMALFTSLTGASGVSILALGGLLYPMVKEATKDEKFSYGIITASGSIGLLFAPALPAIIYAIIANQNSNFTRINVETLFFVALVPSFLLIGIFSTYSFFKERKLIKINKTKQKKKIMSTKQAVIEAGWEIPLPFLVYGGIYMGFISVLEASILTVFYCFIIIFFIRKDLSLRKDFFKVTYNSLKLSGGIFIIMVSSFILTNYIISERIPDKIFNFLSMYINNKYSFLMLINIFLLIIGCLLDIFSAILIILPLIIPLVEKYDINPYHFAIIFLMNLEIGYLTPPVGLNLFIASFRFKKSIVYLYKSIVPFFLMMLIALGLLTYIPALSTFLLEKDNKSLIQKITPPRPKKIEIIKINQENLILNIDLPDQIKFKVEVEEVIVYYLDEKNESIELIKDLGFSETFSIDAKEKVATINLSNLSSDTNYSIILAFRAKELESIHSKIVQIKTLPTIP